MPETVVNKKAPAVATDYDLLSGRDSMAEFYKLQLEDLRSRKIAAAGFLSPKEQEALTLTSDLDILTTKILCKLKVLSDYDPLLNTMRALTGHEDRMDISRELATRHYNKSVTDHFVSQFVDTSKTNSLLGFNEGGGGLRGYRSGIGGELNAGSVWGRLERALPQAVVQAGGGGGGNQAAVNA
jgi:hypothetical protein